MLLIAEEIGRELAESAQAAENTKMIDKSLKLKNSSEEIVSIEGRGRVREVVLTSDSGDYRIELLLDWDYLINAEFSRLMEISLYTKEYEAFYDDTAGKYVFHAGDLKFAKNFRLRVTTTGTVTFDRVYVMYDLVG